MDDRDLRASVSALIADEDLLRSRERETVQSAGRRAATRDVVAIA